MMVKELAFDLGLSWNQQLEEELSKEYLFELKKYLEERKRVAEIYPPENERFSAFLTTSFEKVKVVIVGQDPYHGPGQAHGLCFSVRKGIDLPPSLVNIFKEIGTDLGPFSTTHGSLTSWADQGVLLLNALLSVEKGLPASHKGKGWERFTDQVLRVLNERKSGLVFLLWGKYAQEKGAFINQDRHLVLVAAHPSPFSVSNFYGCRHFSKTNHYLQSKGLSPIDWKKFD